MNYAGGYLSLLSRDESEVLPTAVANLEDLLKLLLSIWRMKVSILYSIFVQLIVHRSWQTMIRNCKAVVDSRHTGKIRADVLREFLKRRPRLSATAALLPVSCDSE